MILNTTIISVAIDTARVANLPMKILDVINVLKIRITILTRRDFMLFLTVVVGRYALIRLIRMTLMIRSLVGIARSIANAMNIHILIVNPA